MKPSKPTKISSAPATATTPTPELNPDDALDLGGRPTKLEPEIEAELLKLISEGAFREVAAGKVGIDPSTLRRWMKRGRAEQHQVGSIFAKFADGVTRAEREAEIAMGALVFAAAKVDAKHAEWWLERKFPKRWGRRSETKLSGGLAMTGIGDLLALGHDDPDA